MEEHVDNLHTTLERNDSSFPTALILSEREMKMTVINKYDEIIWKIRTGYLAILYTALTFLIGIAKVENMDNLAKNPAVSLSLFFLILGLSVSAFSIDCGYVLKKLRVIVVRDLLTDIVYDPECKFKGKWHKLLHVASERPLKKHFPYSQKRYRQKLWWNFRWILLPIYATTPILAIVIFAAIKYLGTGDANRNCRQPESGPRMGLVAGSRMV